MTVVTGTMVTMAEGIQSIGVGMTKTELIAKGTEACDKYANMASRNDGCVEVHYRRMYFMFRHSWRSGSNDVVGAWDMACMVHRMEVRKYDTHVDRYRD